MSAFAEFLRHLVMPNHSRRGRKRCLSARKAEKADKANEETEIFQRASMSKRFPSVNSQKLPDSTGTNEWAQPATSARLTFLSGVFTTATRPPAIDRSENVEMSAS